MNTLQEDQAPVHAEIVSALVEATPATWRAAVLVLENRSDDKHESIRHEIASPDGEPELVSPTDRLFAASYRLLEAFKKHGKTWRKVTYRVQHKADQSWAWQSQFEY